MSKLAWQLRELQKHNRDGSFSTQNSRKEALSLVADQLKELGFNQCTVKGLKEKHCSKLIERWQSEKLATGTMKNRMAHIRWWAAKVNVSHKIPPNGALNIADRIYISNESKAVVLTEAHLERVRDKNIQHSLQLQSLFGLRREEAIKFNPYFADKGTHLELKGSWCKGSRSREIPIITAQQQEFIALLKATYGNNSLIPPALRYVDQLNLYKNTVPTIGIGKGHGLRHNYAQDRYQELSGKECPARGGISQREMSKSDREEDRQIRLQISAELGHVREQITSVYLGS